MQDHHITFSALAAKLYKEIKKYKEFNIRYRINYTEIKTKSDIVVSNCIYMFYLGLFILNSELFFNCELIIFEIEFKYF